MKLYYAPGACSLAPHIVLNEAGLKYEAVKVDLRKKLTEHGDDFNAINPKGYVPTLVLDNGEVLTEGPAITQYIADQVPSSNLAPAWGTLPRYHLLEWLNFISTELHKQFGPFFHGASEEQKASQRVQIGKRFSYINQHLTAQPFLLGGDFTVADAYLFVMLTWAGKVGIELTQWPTLNDYYTRLQARPQIQKTLQAEGLLKT
jgi:glutathione S-transferase